MSTDNQTTAMRSIQARCSGAEVQSGVSQPAVSRQPAAPTLPRRFPLAGSMQSLPMNGYENQCQMCGAIGIGTDVVMHSLVPPGSNDIVRVCQICFFLSRIKDMLENCSAETRTYLRQQLASTWQGAMTLDGRWPAARPNAPEDGACRSCHRRRQ